MDILGAGGSTARRFIRLHGDDVVFTNETVTVDTDTDWDDETYSVVSVTYPTIISRTRVRATRDTEQEIGVDTEVGYVLYVAHDDSDAFDIRDSRGANPPTTATFGETDYEVVGVQTHIDGLTVVEARRS